MKIKKILNNNAVVSSNGKSTFIFIGTGLGFKKKIGDEVDQNHIENKFILEEYEITEKLINMMASIPIEYSKVTAEIVDHSKKVLNVSFSDMFYLSLMDHIHNTVELCKKGVIIHNKMYFEMKNLYPEIMAVAQWAVERINIELDAHLSDEEAANIAMHMISSRKQENISIDNLVKNTNKVHDIIELVRIVNHLDIDNNSLALERFTIHLNFLLERLEMGESKKKNSNNEQTEILKYIGSKNPQAYSSANMIEKYLGVDLLQDEKLYLTLHIRRLINDSNSDK